MEGELVAVVAVAGLVLAIGAGLATALDRPPGRLVLAGCALVEIALLLLTGGAVLALLDGQRPGSLLVFLSYLITTLAVLPLAVLWSIAEPTRWSNAVVAVGGLTVMAMTARMFQIWNTGG